MIACNLIRSFTCLTKYQTRSSFINLKVVSVQHQCIIYLSLWKPCGLVVLSCLSLLTKIKLFFWTWWRNTILHPFWTPWNAKMGFFTNEYGHLNAPFILNLAPVNGIEWTKMPPSSFFYLLPCAPTLHPCIDFHPAL